MAEKHDEKKLLPPYVPYRTFDNFLAGIRSSLPQKIDRSLMNSMSGAMQSQTLLALEYLKLIDPTTEAPTDTLARLLGADQSERQALWQKILSSSYPFLFEAGFQLERATPSELQDRFGKTGATGSTLRKCIAFFLRAAKEGGLELSPYLTKVSRTRTRTGKTTSRANSAREHRNGVSEPTFFEASAQKAGSHHKTLLSKLADKILDKYPNFDPSWPEEQRASWFDGMSKLMTQFDKKLDEE